MNRPPDRLSTAQVADLPKRLPAWAYQPDRGGQIRRSLRFADFAQAFGFMTQVALAAERADHHPEWFNVYSRVEVTLTTHDVGGLSARDLALADTVDRLAAQLGATDG
jgi:4a-hydroxytetrahydrobiopterin dehydratase